MLTSCALRFIRTFEARTKEGRGLLKRSYLGLWWSHSARRLLPVQLRSSTTQRHAQTGRTAHCGPATAVSRRARFWAILRASLLPFVLFKRNHGARSLCSGAQGVLQCYFQELNDFCTVARRMYAPVRVYGSLRLFHRNGILLSAVEVVGCGY